MVLVLDPEMLILDDSFDGLDAGSVTALARALAGCGGAVTIFGNWAQELLRESVHAIQGMVDFQQT